MERNKPPYIAIKIAKKADSVESSAVMVALAGQGVEEAYRGLLEDIYKEYTDTITRHKKSGKFDIEKGVTQADTISPK